jgi:general secretion pathway protein D
MYLAIWSAMNLRRKTWALSTALTVLLSLSTCSLEAAGPSAKSLYARGQTAEAKDDPIGAYEFYYQAYQKEPKNFRYKTAYERLRFLAGSAHVEKGEKLDAQGDVSGALTEYLRALEVDPSNELAHQDIQKAKDKLSSTPTANQETSLPESKQAMRLAARYGSSRSPMNRLPCT